MTKKTKMQETVEQEERQGFDEQLIDVLPENAKDIIREAWLDKKYQKQRRDVLAKEVEQKQKVLELMKRAGLQPVDMSGKLVFKSNGFVITVQPRDEKITVVEEEND